MSELPTAAAEPPLPPEVLKALEEQVKKALAAGKTTVDILGLRAKLPQ